MKYARITNVRAALAIALIAVLTLCLAGCEQHTNIPHLTTSFTKGSDSEYHPQINGTIDDYIYCQVTYTNMSPEPQKDLLLWGELPIYVQLLDDTTKYYDIDHPNGIRVDNDIVEGIQIEECAGFDPSSGETQGETITVKFTLRIIAAPPEDENIVVPITSHITTASGVYTDHGTIVIAQPTPPPTK